ncbi:N,N-dimethylformamidase beta subunit family domain-containing protein [Candidatus Poriferisodalis sp.]|uniref:N,N-dimethylformamidase beta subunit family domain-containing protein n=1 Tax=Candidatus Poriferisodalis sp. TaxID=3101277 RepID=UPI003B5C79B3
MTESTASDDAGPSKQIIGYCEPWTLRAGETIRLMASSHQPGPAEVDVTRIVCGDPTRYGPGFEERPAPAVGNWSVTLDTQPLIPGSYSVADVRGMPAGGPYIGFRLWVMPTNVRGWQRIATLTAPVPESLERRRATARDPDDDLRLPLPAELQSDDPQDSRAEPSRVDLALDLVDGQLMARYPGRGIFLGQAHMGEVSLTANRWYLVETMIETRADKVYLFVATPTSASPGRDVDEAALVDMSVAELECKTFFESMGLHDDERTELYEGVRREMPMWTDDGRALQAWGVGPWPSTMYRYPPNPLFLPERGWPEDLNPAELWLGAGPDGERYDGRIARPVIVTGGSSCTWDLHSDMAARSAGMKPPLGDDPDSGRLYVHQLPTRAITGPAWDGSAHRWSDNPAHFDAIHFHHDDLYDAGWETTVTAALPEDIPSGIYAFRVRSDAGEDRVPFFVRPAADARTADVALLMPTATYMAYANHRMLFEGADFIPTKTRLRPEHAYIRDHPELGRSHYEKHPDRSGVMFNSRLRPVLNLRPGADGWNFTPDTDINAFLEHLEVGHDIVTDEDLHFEGLAAIAPYRVLVTGSHPEYWSTAMLDALADWQRQGGRLMYLGGNGFYWRVAFSDDWPGAIELRRAEDGVRNWQTGPGESYHAWGAEYGGLWRRQGRAPNEICGIGFAAQGFEKATYFVRDPGADSSRASWILEGVPGERIGTSGLGGGAAGQEVDRYDVRLGSPDHAVVLASATTFGPDMLRTKEEFEGSVSFPTPDPYVRADMVFYETPNGGAVFSVGSISWFGALARDGYDNDIARITANVVRRFADPEPFPPPPATD